jgi:hypothetical protein
VESPEPLVFNHDQDGLIAVSPSGSDDDYAECPALPERDLVADSQFWRGF